MALVTIEEIAALKDMDDVLTRMEEKMVEQGEQCKEDEVCSYRDKSKTKACVFGWIIPDAYVNIIIGNHVAREMQEEFKEEWKRVTENLPFLREEENAEIIVKIQDIHDDYLQTNYLGDFGKYFTHEINKLRKEYNIPRK